MPKTIKIDYSSGITLTELMIAMVIMTVGVLGLMASFKYISTSLRVSQSRTVASNLIQEKMAILKNMPYPMLLLTTTPGSDANFTPPIPYDIANYTPETLQVSGVTYTRYTYVSRGQVVSPFWGGNLQTLSAEYPDQGIKIIAVTVVWKERGVWKQESLNNISQNNSLAPTDSVLAGTTYWSSATVSGILPFVALRNAADVNNAVMSATNGNYWWAFHHGTYTIVASAPGFYDVSTTTYIFGYNDQTFDFYMTAIGTTSFSGNVWFNPHLVISQVVDSTINVQGFQNGFETEYTTLLNPTTSQISIANCTPSPTCTDANPHIRVSFDNTSQACNNVLLNYISTYVPAGYYYLIVNSSFVPTSPMMIGGTPVMPDAIYQNAGNPCGSGAPPATWTGPPYSVKHLLEAGKQGAVRIMDSSGKLIDQVGWTKGATIPGNFGSPASDCLPDNTQCLPLNGLGAGNQIVRISSPEATLGALNTDIDSYGQAYNSRYNPIDFLYNCAGNCAINNGDGVVLAHTPSSTASWLLASHPASTIIAGVPALGALVRVSDTFAGSTQTVASYFQSPVNPAQEFIVAPFILVGVSTTSSANPWYVEVATVTSLPSANGYQGYWKQITPLPAVGSLAVGVNYGIPNATTIPAWPIANDYSLKLDSASSVGFVAGMIQLGSYFDAYTGNGYSCGPDLPANANTLQIPPPYPYFGPPCPAIKMQVGSNGVSTGVSGIYFSPAPSGMVTVIANTNEMPPFGSVTANVPVVQGQIRIEDFYLNSYISVSGYVTNGSTPLPGIVVAAFVGGNQVGQATSNTSGNFLMFLSSGVYTIGAIVGNGLSVTPASMAGVSLSTYSINVGTFTVVGSLANISGNITYNSQLFKTGALILASTGTIPSAPPAISAANSPTIVPTYMATSLGDGSFTLPVQQASGYNISVFAPILNGTSVSVTTKTISGINVGLGGAPNTNISLP